MPTPAVPIEILRLLGSSRWAVPVMATLSRHGSAPATMIAQELSLSPYSSARTIDYLRALGWAILNPSHGDPLRQEYTLSEAGRPVGTVCQRIAVARQRLALSAIDLPRWSMAITAELAAGCARFGELEARLDPITPRALSQTLQAMIRHELIARRSEDRDPPVAVYDLTSRGQDLARAVLG